MRIMNKTYEKELSARSESNICMVKENHMNGML